jgi:hypothetical protein
MEIRCFGQKHRDMLILNMPQAYASAMPAVHIPPHHALVPVQSETIVCVCARRENLAVSHYARVRKRHYAQHTTMNLIGRGYA